MAAKILYDEKGYLAFTDKSGNVIDSTEESKIYPTGYFNMIPRNFHGYLDNVKFRHVEVDETLPEGPMRKLIIHTGLQQMTLAEPPLPMKR